MDASDKAGKNKKGEMYDEEQQKNYKTAVKRG